MNELDFIVVGAGPTGLCAALGLAARGYRIGLLERQSPAALIEPAFDGREIALTHRSRQILGTLGVWSRIDPREIAPIERALVLTGTAAPRLRFDHCDTACAALGYLVPNHLIRRAAFETLPEAAGIHLFTDRVVEAVRSDTDAVTVRLDDGETLRASALIAADSRFSDVRRAVGIAADMLDFGKSMLVCRMRHERPHERTALEWFQQTCTVAALPLNGQESSLVITVTATEARHLADCSAEKFARDIESRLHGRLGGMQLSSTRHVYPLVATYARRFVTQRCALLGDAAVGMHPVTAHGFNLGLRSQDSLTHALGAVTPATLRQDLPAALLRYESRHRRHSRPLYLATNAIVRLYTDPRPLATLVRGAALGLAERLRPFKSMALGALTDVDGEPTPLASHDRHRLAGPGSTLESH